MTSNAPNKQMTSWNPPFLTKYAIIGFVETEQVAGVPNSWIKPCGQKTLWPRAKNDSALNKMVKNLEPVEAGDEWAIRIFSHARTYDEMQTKVKRAMYQSDIDSEYADESKNISQLGGSYMPAAKKTKKMSDKVNKRKQKELSQSLCNPLVPLPVYKNKIVRSGGSAVVDADLECHDVTNFSQYGESVPFMTSVKRNKFKPLMTSTQNMKNDGMSKNLVTPLPHSANSNGNEFEVSPIKVNRVGNENSVLRDLVQEVRLLRGELQQARGELQETRAESRAQVKQLTENVNYLMTKSINYQLHIREELRLKKSIVECKDSSKVTATAATNLTLPSQTPEEFKKK